MATYNWIGSDTTLDGDWNTGSLWSGGEVPPDGSDVVIDVINPGTAYTVTIGAGESETVDSLTLNQGGDGTNSDPYVGAYFEMDGTLIFAGPDDGLIAGSRQTQLTTNGGTFVNAGTVAPLFLCNGNVLFTGTNGFYVENALISFGTVTIDTSISEIIGNTLTDGIYSASGPGDIINLGGSGLTVDIQAMEGPQAPDNLGGWSELTLDGPGASINEWNGTAYVSVDTSLTHIMGGGTLDVETGATFTAASTLTIDHTGASDGAGMLNLQDGTVVAAAIDLENGILQGSGTVSDPLINNGTVMAVNGTLDLTGSVTGTGIIEFDTDIEAQLAGTVAATLMVNSVSAGQTIMMNGDDTLVLNTPTAFAGTIEASIGAEIVLQGMTATTAVVTGGNLVISDGSAVVDTLALSGSVVADGFLATGSIITVTTAFPAPTISGAVANQAVSGTATIDPFSSVTIADPNAAATDTVTVALSAAANGTLSNLGTGSYNSTTGVYTATGSTSALTTDLDGLVFTPTAAAAGQTVTTGFNISVIDTLGASATDSTTSVTATFSLTPTPTPTPAPTPTPTPAPTPTPTVIPGFSAVDMSTDQAITTGPTPYSGPVSGLTDEYITTTSDNLNISVSTPGWFIHTGSGEDAIQVSSGTNVLDGSTGSNFLVGGTGDDTFFVDDRSPAASVWSTISNFHSGDAATVWGVTPGDFTLTWVDGQGAAGYTGLTLHVTASGEPTASLTLAGYTSAALTNGALTISYGTTAAENGVPGSTYMYVHAN